MTTNKLRDHALRNWTALNKYLSVTTEKDCLDVEELYRTELAGMARTTFLERLFNRMKKLQTKVERRANTRRGKKK